MTLTLQQALNQLDSVTSLNELYALAAQVDVTGGGAGAQTILYSGGLSVNPEAVDSISNSKIAQSYADAIDQTTSILEGDGRGAFMASRDFLEKLADVEGFNSVNTLLEFSKANPQSNVSMAFIQAWDSASLEFAQKAHGNVIIASTNASLGSVLARVELPELLNNVNVTSINGIPKSLLVSQYNLDLNTSAILAMENLLGTIEYQFAGAAADFRFQEPSHHSSAFSHRGLIDDFDSPSTVRSFFDPNDRFRIATNDGFAKLGSPELGAVNDLVDGNSSVLGTRIELGSLTALSGDVNIDARRAATSARFSGAKAFISTNRVIIGNSLDGLGIAGDVVGVVLVGGIAIELLQAGQRSEAAAVLANEFGSLATGLSTAALTAPLLLLGPGGWIAFAAINIATSYGGGELAEHFERNTGFLESVLPDISTGAGQQVPNPIIDSRPTGNPILLPYDGYDSVQTLDGRVFINHSFTLDGTGNGSENIGFSLAIDAARDHWSSLGPERQQHLFSFFEENPEFKSRELFNRLLPYLEAGGVQGFARDELVGLENYDYDGLRTINNIVLYGHPDQDGPAIVVTGSHPGEVDGGRPVDVLETAVDNTSGIYDDGRSTVVDSPDVEVTLANPEQNGGGASEEQEIEIRDTRGTSQNSISTTFAQAGAILGGILGARIAGNDKLAQVVGTAVGSTALSAAGFFVDGLTDNLKAGQSIERSLDLALKSLPQNFLNAGKGALSSYITAELVNALGVDGLAGEALNTGAGIYIGDIITNILDGAANPFAGIGSGATLASAAASFLGTKLANEIHSFESIGGQIGAAIGVAAIGAVASTTTIFGTPLIAVAFSNPGTALFAIGAFAAAALLGGLIGSIFGGTPRSGADTIWDEEEGRFVVANTYSRKGGSESTAISLASTVVNSINGVISATGAQLSNPSAITTGNYGMRKSDFVYRPVNTRSREAITFSVSSKQDGAAEELINFGLFTAFKDSDFQLLGGNLYSKRAVYNVLGGFSSHQDFDFSSVSGGLIVAQNYERYIKNRLAIDAIVASKPDSVFALELANTILQARGLGITKRHEADWFGGYEQYFDTTKTSAANTKHSLFYDGASGQIVRSIQFGRYTLGDTTDIAGQTTIKGTAASETITLSYRASNEEGFAIAGGAGLIHSTSAGTTVNGVAWEATDTVDVAATIDAGAGNDIVHGGDLGNNIFGGEGNDTLYGGVLDDWLLGGDGDDDLYAGASAGATGGNGNYLNGGAGNDDLFGAEGSDWLEGGDGVDVLAGAGGDDILSGGAGAADSLSGGAGDDSYILRLGDGADIVTDVDNDALALSQQKADHFLGLSGGYWAALESDYTDAFNATNAGYVTARLSGFANNHFVKDWTGYLTPGVSDDGFGGGEDSVVMGQGIGIGDVRLKKSVDGDDLIIQVMGVDGNGVTVETGDQLTLTDWFVDPFQRIEWLKFADGNEIRIGDITSFIAGTNGADELVGTLGNDFIYGGDGNDRLHLLAGDDIGSGGNGLDYIAGDSGDDLIVGGADGDALTGGTGEDVLSGDGGNDDLYGGDGNDIISGGRGDDHLVGGAGDDIFKYSRGDGADVIFDEFAGTWETVWQRTGTANGGFAAGYTLQSNGEITINATGEIIRKNIGTAQNPQYQWIGRWDYDSDNEVLRRLNPAAGSQAVDSDGTLSWRWDPVTGLYTSGSSLGDTIEFAPGINIQDIVLRESGDDLVMHISGDDGSSGVVSYGGDSITLKDWALSPNNIERLAFFSTGELDLTAMNILAGTDGDDSLSGVDNSGSITGNWITGGTGEDIIVGGDGDDILSGNGGIDIIRGGAGDDVLYGGAGDDVLIGGMDINLVGTRGDILIGGAGSDWASYEDSTNGVVVSLANPGQNTGEAKRDSYASIENLRGGTGDDTLTGDAGENMLDGGKGQDTLQGMEGDDTYIWNATSSSDHDGAITIKEGVPGFVEVYNTAGQLQPGYTVSLNEILEMREPSEYGGLNKVFALTVSAPGGGLVYSKQQTFYNVSFNFVPGSNVLGWPNSGWLGSYGPTGDGLQVASLGVSTGDHAGDDTIELGEGIGLADLSFSVSGDDLIIQYQASSASQITIKSQNTVGGKVEFLQLHDGLSASLENLKLAVHGAATDDLIVGTSANNTLNGNAGDDVMYGGSGADILHGNAGDDVIEGGAGADTLYGDANSASDSGNANWGDTVRYASSTVAVTVDLRLTTAQSGGDAAGDVLSGFENVTGSLNFGDTINGDDNGNRLFGLGGDDILRGHNGDDVIVGGEGDDDIYGGDGDDNLDGGAGNDYFEGNDGDDIIAGGDGNDRLYGHAGNDQLIAGAGNDNNVRGGGGDDIVDGGAGNDTIHGDAGNDTLIGGTGNDVINGGTGDDIFVLGENDGTDTITDTSGINTIVFGENITRDKIWLTRQGNNLRIGIIGGDSVATVTGFYAGSSLINKLQTAEGTLFINHAAVLGFIDDMTVESANATPAEMSADMVSALADYWENGETAAPRAPAQPLSVTVANHGANTINLDGWANIAPTGKGENLVADDGWPGDIDAVPAGDIVVDGWVNSAGRVSEGEWISTVGPYGQQIISAHTGQTDSDSSGGGNFTNEIAIDGFKAYEFSYYVKLDELQKHRLYLGAGTGNRVKEGNSDTVVNNPYFMSGITPTTTLGFETDKWYKVVAYVLPESAEAQPAGTYGGVYDTETGEKLDGVTVEHFRWNEARPEDTTFLRFFNAANTTAQGLYTHFYRPEVHEIDPLYIMQAGDSLDPFVDSKFIQSGAVEGFQNSQYWALDGESRWIEVQGPDGNSLIALQAGQFDDVQDGGGNRTNSILADTDKTYRYTQYVRKSDLEKHSIQIGLLVAGDNSNFVKRLDTGASAHANLLIADSAAQVASLDEDKWYRLVGYVFDKDTMIDVNEAHSGLYDAETGAKVMDVPSYLWSGIDAEVTVKAWFRTEGDTLDHGWSTYFGPPSITAIGDADLAAVLADPLDLNPQNVNTISATTFSVSGGVTDHDNNIVGYEINPDGAPSKGTIEIVNAVTGEVKYTPFSGEIGSDSFSVLVRDADDNVTVVPVDIELELAGVNSAPTMPEGGFEVTIDENSAVEALAGTLSAIDPDGDSGIDFMFDRSLTTMVAGQYVTFSEDNKFRMERDSGNVRLNAGELDYENGSREFNYDVRVTDKDSGHNSRAAYSTLKVTVDDVNEAHSLGDATIDVNHYSRALGPFVPMPDANGFAINLRQAMLDDPENGNTQWSVTQVKRNGTVISTHPWSVNADGSLHLDGAILANETYVLTIEANDPELAGSAVSATLTLNVGADDGFVVNPAIFNYDWLNFNFNFNWSGILAPIVLDLDGDGVELVSFTSSTAEFDMDGDGNRDKTGWFGADDGLLVLDADNNNIVDDGSEISFQRFVDGAFSDLEGLAFFDTNENGLLDGGDDRFGEFKIWRDTNQDGITDDGELQTLSGFGIENISLSGTLTGDLPNANDNVLYATASYQNSDGTSGTVGDTFFVFDPLSNLPGDDIPEVPAGNGDDVDGGNIIEFGTQHFDRKKKKFRLAALEGLLFISPKKVRSVVDPRSGQLAPSMILNFTDKNIGLLSTIILDLDGDGLETRHGSKTDAWFDMDGNGSADNTGWTGRGDGYLVVDRNGNGIVDNGSELSFMSEVSNARNGLQGLAAFDDNGDGIVSAADARFGELKLWVDRNENGRTDAGELGTLEQHGIESFSLNGSTNSERVKVGKNIVLATSIFTRTNGFTGTLGDTVLSFTPSADPIGSSMTSIFAPSLSFNRRLRDIAIPREAEPELDAITMAELDQLRAGSDANVLAMTSAGLAFNIPHDVNPFDHFSQAMDEGQTSGTSEASDVSDKSASIEADNSSGESDVGEPVIHMLDIKNVEMWGGPAIVDLDDLRVALMTQDMNSFGARSAGETAFEQKYGTRPVDFFAA